MPGMGKVMEIPRLAVRSWSLTLVEQPDSINPFSAFPNFSNRQESREIRFRAARGLVRSRSKSNSKTERQALVFASACPCPAFRHAGRVAGTPGLRLILFNPGSIYTGYAPAEL